MRCPSLDDVDEHEQHYHVYDASFGYRCGTDCVRGPKCRGWRRAVGHPGWWRVVRPGRRRTHVRVDRRQAARRGYRRALERVDRDAFAATRDVTAMGVPPAISLTISDPVAGVTISADRVTVRGTIAGPANVGVSVNGVTAVVSGHASLQPTCRSRQGRTS